MVTTEQLSQLRAVPADRVADMASDLEHVKIPWKEAYSDYQAGGWSTAPLLNSSGSVEQTRLDGRAPKPTSLYADLPHVRDFIEESQLDVLLARLAKVDVGAWMHEHNDEAGFNPEQRRLRIHLPLVTNRDATLSIAGALGNENVFLKPFYLWKLDHENVPHSASNLGNEARVHLILDCHMNPKLRELIAAEQLDRDAIRTLPLLTADVEATIIQTARILYSQGQREGNPSLMKGAEELIISLFHTFDLQGRSSYDILLDMFNGLDNVDARRAYWVARLREVRGRSAVQPR